MKADCCCQSQAHPDACGCCEGTEALTPLPTRNRPGLPALSYRAGTHATFLETMKARLSNLCLGSEKDCKKGNGVYPLAKLTSRAADDFSIALLDACATVADVLTFYQERIINEGYLRTATERFSVLELARLVGYQPRPGVSSSVYLAYTLDDNLKEEITLPKGARSQSIPGQDEMPQTFETSEDLKARAQWNNLRPRLTRPQTKASIEAGNGENQRIYLKGISSNLKPNDPLLIDFDGSDNTESFTFVRIKEVQPELAANRTLVILQDKAVSKLGNDRKDPNDPSITFLGGLTRPSTPQISNSLRLKGNINNFAIDSSENKELLNPLASADPPREVLKAFVPALQTTLAAAEKNADITEPNPIRVYALRSKAYLFGHSYPGISSSTWSDSDGKMVAVISAGLKFTTVVKPVPLSELWPLELLGLKSEGERKNLSRLDQLAVEPKNDQLQQESWIVIEWPYLTPGLVTNHESGRDCQKEGNNPHRSFHKVTDVQEITLGSHVGYVSDVNVLELEQSWSPGSAWNKPSEVLDCIALLRETTVYTQSELLELAEEPIVEPFCGEESEFLELDDLYDGLEPGRWVIVSGERSDIPGTSGVRSSELAMLSSVVQNVQFANKEKTTPLAGDKLHSFIKLDKPLAYCFKRDTVTIYGNVVKATHGETRREVLGSGDGAKALQSFVLKQPPLTFVAAANPSGVDSTLRVFVNDIRWRESDTLAGLTPTERRFITRTDDDGKTAVVFGNGREGARLPTGIENIKAEYRSGIGKAGNVNAEQISMLITRPLGVKEVINPLRASGGADKETRDQARKNTPLAVKALDRLVSVQDYEDFTRIYAGIGKAKAVELSDGRRQLVHITIAGIEDMPIETSSDLYRNLQQALLDCGDPYQAIRLEVRELMLIVISANIRILPDYQWEPVVTKVRAMLLDAFSFERRELGQDVLLSEVISVMQAVPGVAYVDVDVLRGIPEKILDKGTGQRRLLTPVEIAEYVTGPLKDVQGEEISPAPTEPLPRLVVNLADKVSPAQLAFLTPDVPETLILNQII
ncbi:MAG: putative baseplate assembly protein [Nitrosomonas sp.]|nr:putative baseplate assembly protein [Nitrosomonas sp.]MDL1865567.1 putative baseplate assembly protein [Betaproteobacteria bacterium PRO5]